MADRELNILLRLKDEASKSLQAFGTQVNAIKPGLESFGTSMTRSGELMGRLGGEINKLSLPLLAAGGASIKFATDFQTTMNQIVGLTGTSRTQMEEWRKSILSLGGQVAKTPVELAKAMYFIASSGVEGSKAMDVLTVSAKAASAGLGDTQVIADLVSSALNAYGSENLSAAQATDALVAAVREGKAEAPAMADAIGRVIPVASQMGVSFDQVAAAIAGMTRTGSDADEATTSLRQILVSILKPTKEASDTLKSFGLSAQGLRDEIREKGLLAALQTMTKAIGDNDDAQGKIFGNVRALTGVMSLLGANAEENVGIFDALKNSTGSLDTAFDAVANGTGFKLQAAMAKLQAAAIQVGDVLAPHVIKMADAISKAADAFAKMPAPLQNAVVGFVAFLAILGPVVSLIGTIQRAVGLFATFLASPQGIALINGFGVAFTALRTAAMAAGAALAGVSAPVWIIVAIVAAVIAALVLLVLHWDKVKAAVISAGKAIGDWAKKIGTDARAAFDNFRKSAEEGMQKVGDAVNKYLDQVSQNFRDSMAKTREEWSTGWANFVEVARNVGSALADAGDYILAVLQGALILALDALLPGWQQKWQEFVESAIQIWGTITDRVAAVWENFKTNLLMAWSSLLEPLQATWIAISDAAMAIWNSIADFFTAWWGRVGEQLKVNMNAFKAVWQAGWQLVQQLATTVWNTISGAWNIVLQALKGAWDGFSAGFTSAWRTMWSGVGSFFSGIWESIKGAFRAAMNFIIDGINKIINAINKMIDGLNAVAKVGGRDKGGIGRISNIPQLATGGIVTNPTLAMIGERGPEAVIPLSRMGNMGGGVNIVINGDVSGEDLIDKVEEALTHRLKVRMAI